MPIRPRTNADRRTFLTRAGGTMAVLAAAGAPNVIAQPKVQWRMPTAWPASALSQTTALRLAQVVEEMSGGRFRIEIFPAGQLALPFDLFEAASRGEIQAFMASPQYWQNREPAFEWFGTIPFGMNPLGMTAWLYQGDGLKLWEEASAPFNLVPRPIPTAAPQMAGWFRKKINTIGDFKGLRMRIPNLGGQVVTRAGGTTGSRARATAPRLSRSSASAWLQRGQPEPRWVSSSARSSFSSTPAAYR